jgi:hypothetical protein
MALLALGARAENLRVFWSDVEGGAATLIVTPAGESILIDSGSAGNRDAQRIFKAAGERFQLKQIDFLITTHFHSDHFGGAAELAGLIPIKTVYDNGVFDGGYERPTKVYELFPAEKRLVLNPGDELPLKNLDGQPRVSLKCICARQKFIDPPAGAQPNAACANPERKGLDKTDNANSIVVVLSCGDFRLYAAGDLTWNVEEKLVCPVNLIGKVDVYQCTHHGLEQSNNPLVLNAIAPTAAVMSNGTTKGSEPGTWKALRAAASVQATFQIHKNLRADKENNTPDELIANLEKNCEGHGILLELDAAAHNYTLSIPATKVNRTFAVTAK